MIMLLKINSVYNIMIDPVVCFTCGKVISHLIEEYREILRKNDKRNNKEILDSLGLKRYCCRIKVLTSINVSQELPFVF